jgi:hypothetical protein
MHLAPSRFVPSDPLERLHQRALTDLSTNGQSFFLRSGQQELGFYGLPLYFTSSGQRVK